MIIIQGKLKLIHATDSATTNVSLTEIMDEKGHCLPSNSREMNEMTATARQILLKLLANK